MSFDQRSSVDLGTWTYGAQELAPAADLALPPMPTREMIQALQERIAGLPQTEYSPVHHFADGMYGRELPIKAGEVVIGKIHRHEHFVLLLSGEATINTDRGMERIAGPHIWVSQPGAQRALVTHTDCVFFTTHLNATNTRDLDVIEAYVIEPEPLLTQSPPQLSEFADELQEVFA